jgi:uncharacterized protein (TIGR03382 family)
MNLTLPTTHRLFSAAVALALGAAAATGCNTAELPDRTSGPSSSNSEEEQTATAKQTLGESNNAVSFGGAASTSIPSYHERLTLHLMNRMRMDPEAFGLKYPMMHPRAGEFIDPVTPFATDPGMIEAGRWQGRHALKNSCMCPQGPMAGPPGKNTCCDMVRKDGKVQCASSIVKCDHPKATEEQRRWKLLATGTSGIKDEFYVNQNLPADQALPALPGDLLASQMAGNALYFIDSSTKYFGVAQTSRPAPPEKCQPPSDPCQVGTCTNLSTGANLCNPDENPECSGVCKGPGCNGVCETEDSETGETRPVSCTLPTPPDPNECQPSKYPKGYYVSFLQGNGSGPVPTLLNGLHMKLGYTQTQDGTIDAFGTTPPDKQTFSVHYFEPSGDAQSANVVVGGQCHSMQVTKRNVTGGDASGGDAGATADASSTDADVSVDADAGPKKRIFGLRYGANVGLQAGCHRYVFSFTDADGFVHTYPSYGSLGAKLVEVSTEGGDTIAIPTVNDENCPIWSPNRPSMSCLPEGDQCVAGETRQCYTGRDNTRGRGICGLGTEECENGRWTGTCKNQTLPDSEETCGDGKDNDCNGFVDEGCDDGGEDAGGSDSDGGMSPTGGDTGPSTDTNTDDDGGTTPDAGGTGGDTTGGSTSDGGGSGSADTGGSSDDNDDDDDAENRGCGCSAPSDGVPPMMPSVFAFALGVLALRRRG